MSAEHNQHVVSGLQPEPVWRIFAGLASVPRPSKNEAGIQAHVKQWAEHKGLTVKHEPVGNLVLRVPASKGHEQAPTVVLQGHLDMVAEKNSDVKHDFDRDPIRLRIDRERSGGAALLRAEGTTLGADNGVGVALALAAASEKSVVHGPLEILLTCDEEAGMTGARAVTSDTIRGRVLINLDSEEDDALYIGCAGGADSTLIWKIGVQPAASTMTPWTLAVRGLVGGHSGCDIHLNRGNALKLLAQTLHAAGLGEVRLAELTGGSKRNAIPREAQARVAATPEWGRRLAQAAARLQELARAAGEERCTIVANGTSGPAATGPTHVISSADTARVVNCLLGLPSSVLATVPEIPGLVQTSNNLSTAEFSRHDGEIELRVGCLSRSSSMPELARTCEQVAAVGRLAGAQIELGDSYPGWQPNPKSPLLEVCRKAYLDCLGTEPHVRSIHAGLECGIIGEAVGGKIDMISFGPTILGAHSPDERVSIESVAKIWKYLCAVLAALAK